MQVPVPRPSKRHMIACTLQRNFSNERISVPEVGLLAAICCKVSRMIAGRAPVLIVDDARQLHDSLVACH